MPRVSLNPLDKYGFQTEITVRTTDLNYGGHLGNDRLLALAHEARVAWLASHEWTELDCAGASLIMGDAAIVFQGEAFAGDRLTIEVGASEPGRCGFRLGYRVTRNSGNDTPPVAIALMETGMVCFDYDRGRVARLPAEVLAALG